MSEYISGEALDKRLEAVGLMPVGEVLNYTPMDGFRSHAGVVDLQSLYDWVVYNRRSLLEQIARHELGIHILDEDIYDFILGQSSAFSEVHINMKKVIHV